MANLWVTLNSIKLFPALPIEQDEEPVGTATAAVSGDARFYWRADKSVWLLTRANADEATTASWRSAAPMHTALTFVDVDGGSYTVRVTRRRFRLVRTKPSVNGSATATGPLTYDLELELRQL